MVQQVRTSLDCMSGMCISHLRTSACGKLRLLQWKVVRTSQSRGPYGGGTTNKVSVPCRVPCVSLCAVCRVRIGWRMLCVPAH
jgi:hypothetical protein